MQLIFSLAGVDCWDAESCSVDLHSKAIELGLWTNLTLMCEISFFSMPMMLECERRGNLLYFFVGTNTLVFMVFYRHSIG